MAQTMVDPSVQWMVETKVAVMVWKMAQELVPTMESSSVLWMELSLELEKGKVDAIWMVHWMVSLLVEFYPIVGINKFQRIWHHLLVEV